MYPSNLFALFPPFPKENTVFVVMSFDKRFESRWENVIKPSIEKVLINETPLTPIRVDTSNISDSILTEILIGIGNSRLVFADLTTIGVLDNRPIRNGNVMYEIGIAQATRLPEEVILFRSDNDPLPFDTATVRVNSYNPDENIDESIDQVINTINSTVEEIDLKRHLAVEMSAKSLDHASWLLLSEICTNSKVTHPIIKTVGEILGNSSRLNSINRLLEMGVIRTIFPKVPKDLLVTNTKTQTFMYEATEFGESVFNYVSSVLISSS